MSAQLFQSHPEWKRFIKLLKKLKAKVRPGCKQTVNLHNFTTLTLYTVEMELTPRRWLPIRFPQSFGSFWYFPGEQMRDRFLEAYKEAAA